MQPTSKFKTGIRYGLITGLVYLVLLFIRYKFFVSTPLTFYGLAAGFFLIIMALYLFAGIARKKELNGYATFKDIFQTIFVTILITELAFVLFNVVYFRYVDPEFWETFKAGARTFFEKYMPGDQADQQMKMLDEQGSQLTPGAVVRSFGFSVIVDSIIGMIFASILRKKKDVFPETDI